MINRAGDLRQFAARRKVPVAVAVLIVLIALIVFVLPGLLANGTFKTDAERLKAENDIRSTLLQALGGAILLSGLYFTARTLQLNREGQITERFTRAIDQLGNEKSIDVRLGGIYALERIAHDSEHDRETIFDVLAAFLRQHAPRGDLPDGPSAEAKAVANVLARRRWRPTDRPLDLSDTDLRGASFEGSFLAHALLRRADLADADLSDALLTRADLTDANLTDANLFRADLKDAVFRNANLTRAFFDWADLRDADLTGADLTGANFTGTSLMGAFFMDARLTQAVLRENDLTDVNLRNADLTGADLTGANLWDAELTGADLTDAYLTDAKLPRPKPPVK